MSNTITRLFQRLMAAIELRQKSGVLRGFLETLLDSS